MSNIIKQIDAFISETGLSEHRAGMVLAKNGRLVERLRSGRRIWPETEAEIVCRLAEERAARGLDGKDQNQTPESVTPENAEAS